MNILCMDCLRGNCGKTYAHHPYLVQDGSTSGVELREGGSGDWSTGLGLQTYSPNTADFYHNRRTAAGLP